jgi:cytochrome c
MSLENNKVFAAVCIALIAAWGTAFVAEKLVHPHDLEKDAVEIEGEVAGGGGAVAKPQVPQPILHLIAAADIAKGEKLSKACAACHSFEQGGPHKVGPNLWNVVNSSKATKSGFGYSSAMSEKAGTWDYQSLNFFMWKPKKYVPGTNMNYLGLKKPEDRAAIIAWLATLSSSPKPPPSAAQIANELADFAPPAPADEGIEEAAAPAPAAP